MSTNDTNTTSAPVSTEVTVKSVISALVDGATREMSGFDLLDRSGMMRVRKALDARLIESVRFGKNDGSAVVAAMDTIKPGTGGSPKVVTESDVRTVLGEHAAMLRHALNAVLAGNVTVNGYDGDVSPLSDNEDETDIPEMTDKMVEQAEKWTTFTFGTKTKENDIPALIRAVFANVPTGTFYKVSDIRKRIGTETGISVNAGWDGRINAYLFNEDKNGQTAAQRHGLVESVRPGHSAYDGKNGAIKVESDGWNENESGDSDN